MQEGDSDASERTNAMPLESQLRGCILPHDQTEVIFAISSVSTCACATGDLEQVEAHKLGVHLCTCLALTIPITYEDMYNFEGTSNGRNGYSGGMQGCRVRYLAAPAGPALLLFSFAHG